MEIDQATGWSIKTRKVYGNKVVGKKVIVTSRYLFTFRLVNTYGNIQEIRLLEKSNEFPILKVTFMYIK